MIDSEIYDPYNEIGNIVPELSRLEISKIINAYNEKWRIFHNFSYMRKMLAILDESLQNSEINFSDEEISQLKTIILFHRYIYKLGFYKEHNTMRSPKAAQEILFGAGKSNNFCQIVFRGIAFISEKEQRIRIQKLMPSKPKRVISWFLDVFYLTRYGRNSEEFRSNLKKIMEERLPIMTKQESRLESLAEFQNMLIRKRIFLNSSFQSHEIIIRKLMEETINHHT